MLLLKKALPSREEPDISLSIVSSEVRLHLLYTRYGHIIRGPRVKVALRRSYVALLMCSVVPHLHDICAVHIR